jgi:type II secretory pathway predicted ATPase ExeA
MSYIEHFGIDREPFSNAPDARFYFNTAQHSEALIRLMYAVDSNKGLAVLVGGVGTGKTTLARRMLDSLPEERYESSLLVIIHSSITTEWILTRIALQLRVPEPAGDRLKLLKQLRSPAKSYSTSYFSASPRSRIAWLWMSRWLSAWRSSIISSR